MPTIGVAISVPEPWATELQEFRRDVGDPMADLIPTHITLVPPTPCDEERLRDVHDHLGAAACDVTDYHVELRGTDSFRPVTPVVFVAVVDGFRATEHLADQVRSGPLAVDLEFPFHPHVTVAHHLDEASLDRAESGLSHFTCDFTVGGFDLFVHDADLGWQASVHYEFGRGAVPGAD